LSGSVVRGGNLSLDGTAGGTEARNAARVAPTPVDECPTVLPGGALALATVAFAAGCGTGTREATTASRGQADQTGGNLLTEDNFTIKSILEIDLDKSTATFPLHKGFGPDGSTPVWYIITEASDFGLAHDLNVNFAPKLANMSIDCPTCVQETTLTTSPGNKFSEAPVNFKGIPDFGPTRVLTPGPTGFPPLGAQPGAVGDDLYSPFIRIKGSSVVYNAPIVAVGDGPFDVETHTNTSDRTMAISTDPAKMTRRRHGPSWRRSWMGSRMVRLLPSGSPRCSDSRLHPEEPKRCHGRFADSSRR